MSDLSIKYNADRFLQYLELEKRYSKHTLLSYSKDLEQLIEYSRLHFESQLITEINHQVIRSFVLNMMDKGVSPRSVNRKLSAFKSFFRFLQKQKKLEHNPLLKVSNLKNPKKLPRFVEESKMKALLELNENEDSFSAIRDECILELLYATGIRLSELIGLKPRDFDSYSHCIKVLGKRNKERIVPLTAHIENKLISYLQCRTNYLSEMKKDCEQLFFTDACNRLYPKFVYKLVKQALSRVTSMDQKSPHVLRHTFATHLLNNGADINAIKELLGHSSLAATQVYTHNSIEKLKKAYKDAHPKA
ncbi:MAG TPA: tyrosine-type recombinase/integrase [Bacteroidia bacterium]|nr:tyrosine-type recombinase/integrase [Bacteroidia bacterium]HNT80526.1 tyrosine-type recombinase/integrase [Bacteroidia bacterium]